MILKFIGFREVRGLIDFFVVGRGSSGRKYFIVRFGVLFLSCARVFLRVCVCVFVRVYLCTCMCAFWFFVLELYSRV